MSRLGGTALALLVTLAGPLPLLSQARGRMVEPEIRWQIDTEG